MINIHQLYVQREITKVKWIYRDHNLTDFIIKANLLLALKILIDINCINITTTEWVEQVSIKQVNKKI